MSDHELTSYSKRVYSYFKYFKSNNEPWLIRPIEIKKHQDLLSLRVAKPVETNDVLHVDPSLLDKQDDLVIDLWRNNKVVDTDPVIEISFPDEDGGDDYPHIRRRMTMKAFKELIANTDEYYGDPRR